MARIRILSWNIQVYGPGKYAHPPNAVALVNFIGTVANEMNANVVVIYETMTSIAQQVAFNVNEALAATTGANWDCSTQMARIHNDRESYGFFWRNGANFVPAVHNNGNRVTGLSTLEFPNNFSNIKGRRAAYMTFRTTDTNRYFTTTAYHAPPNARAIRGLEQLAQMDELYAVANAPPPPPEPRVPARLLAGDYNLDVNVQPDYTWLTNPVPNHMPPLNLGEGAGCLPAVFGDTGLRTYASAVRRWGAPLGGWPQNPTSYRRPLAIDNVFWATPVAAIPQGSVVDLIERITNPGTNVGAAARAFALQRQGGRQAFPHAAAIPAPLNLSLNTAAYAYVLYRYAISDHLPVYLTLTI